MLEISYACCLGLSPAAQFALKMCVAARNRKTFTKNLYFTGSRSFKVIDVVSFKKARHGVLVIIGSIDVINVKKYNKR